MQELGEVEEVEVDAEGKGLGRGGGIGRSGRIVVTIFDFSKFVKFEISLTLYLRHDNLLLLLLLCSSNCCCISIVILRK